MAQLAEATNSVISAVLFGALAGSKALPMQRMAFEAAIHRGGVGVKESIAAFGAGFAAAEGGPSAVAVPAAAEGHSAGADRAVCRGRSVRRPGADVSCTPASSGSPTTRTSTTRASIWRG